MANDQPNMVGGFQVNPSITSIFDLTPSETCTNGAEFNLGISFAILGSNLSDRQPLDA
jgi:hypothetical protein